MKIPTQNDADYSRLLIKIDTLLITQIIPISMMKKSIPVAPIDDVLRLLTA